MIFYRLEASLTKESGFSIQDSIRSTRGYKLSSPRLSKKLIMRHRSRWLRQSWLTFLWRWLRTRSKTKAWRALGCGGRGRTRWRRTCWTTTRRWTWRRCCRGRRARQTASPSSGSPSSKEARTQRPPRICQLTILSPAAASIPWSFPTWRWSPLRTIVIRISPGSRLSRVTSCF